MWEQILVVLVLVLVRLSHQARNNPWTDVYTADNFGSFYYFSDNGDAAETSNFYAKASRKCREVGGHLAVFKNRTELEFATTTAKKLQPGGVDKDGILSSLASTTIRKYGYHVGYASSSYDKNLILPESYTAYTYADIIKDTLGDDTFLADSATPLPDAGFHAWLKWVTPGSAIDDFKFGRIPTGSTNMIGYICQLEKNTCACAKVNEPVIRTFDGQPIQLDAYCQYTLLETRTYKVEIRTAPAKYKLDNKDYPENYPQLGVIVDEVRITNAATKRIYVLARSQENTYGGVRVYGFESTSGAIVNVSIPGDTDNKHFEFRTGFDTWNEKVAIDVKDVPPIIAQGSGGMQAWKTNAIYVTAPASPAPPQFNIYYDGYNVELTMPETTAKAQNKGLCGACEGKKRLVKSDGFETPSTYAYGYSWINPDTKDQCPATMYRPAACVSDLMYRKAIDRCQLLVDWKHPFNMYTNGCVSKYLSPKILTVPLADRENLFTACVSSTCEFGPKATCYYVKKALWYCGVADPDAFLKDGTTLASDLNADPYFLDCNPDKLCDMPSVGYSDSNLKNGTCYLVEPTKERDAFASERFCQERFAHLPTFHSIEEYKYLKNTYASDENSFQVGPGDYMFWLGRVIGKTDAYNKFNKEANLDGSRVDLSIYDVGGENKDGPRTVLEPGTGPCVAMGSSSEWAVLSGQCSAPAKATICAFKAYVPCGDGLCFHPMKCDQPSGTCYDPCFDQGFYSEGRCYSMFNLPNTPNTTTTGRLGPSAPALLGALKAPYTWPGKPVTP